MTLDGAARAWDPTGSASADRLVMNQKTGDFTAEGHVATTHVPDNKDSSKPGSTAMLSNAEVMQGRAQHMTSAQHNQKLHYEGNAVVWQGANRVEADRIDIDRAAQAFEAHGKVVSQFIDKSKDADQSPKSSKAAPGCLHGGARAGSAVFRRHPHRSLPGRRCHGPSGADRDREGVARLPE